MSVRLALKRLGHDAVITADPDVIRNAEKVIIPGVGEAASAMKHLRERGLDRVIVSLQQPVLGICLGLQLMCNFSEENNTQCLGIFDAIVRRFPAGVKVPHMGWNDFASLNDDPLLKGSNPKMMSTMCTAIMPLSTGLPLPCANMVCPFRRQCAKTTSLQHSSILRNQLPQEHKYCKTSLRYENNTGYGHN